MSDVWDGRGPAEWVRILRGGLLVAMSTDGREGHRVRPWPDLTAESWDPKRGRWHLNRSSAERLLALYGGGCRGDSASPRLGAGPASRVSPPSRPDGRSAQPGNS